MDFKFHTLFLSLFSVAAAAVLPPGERIVNGVSIDIEQTPWMISLLLNSTHNCGGSILSERIILTAAHCLEDLIPENLMVRAGSRYCEHGGQLLQVEDFKMHEYYNTEGTINDVGIVLLAAPLKFGPQVQPVELAQENPKYGEFAFISGWGLLYESRESAAYPKDLQGVYVDMLDKNTCLSYIYPRKADDVICARGSGKGFCFADSGGPLVRNRVQVGIVSFSERCGSSYPDFYASVAYFYNWIQDTIKNLENRI